jgi:hypothetical protein
MPIDVFPLTKEGALVSIRIIVGRHFLLLATSIGEEDKTTLSLDSASVEVDEVEECILHWVLNGPLPLHSKSGNLNIFQSPTTDYCVAESNCIRSHNSSTFGYSN